MILTFIGLFIYVYYDCKENPSVKFYQDFIKKSKWVGKKITLAFNVSDEYKNRVIFSLFDPNNEIINLSKCNEELVESEDFVYYCIVNYSITKNSFSSHALKLHLNLTEEIIDQEYKIPFSFTIREPNINHTNYENPLDLYDQESINKFKCFYYTKEITSYRRYIKIINYTTDGGYIHDDQNIDEIYLDDFEDSRKTMRTNQPNEKNFIGSYRILLSKKIDVYERKYDSFWNIISRVGGYSTPVFLIFGILIFIFVKPYDNIRIYKALKKEGNDLTETIYNDYIKDNNEYNEDFNNIDSFKNEIDNNNCFNKIKNQIMFLFCYCCYYNKRTKHLYLINKYIDDNVSLENKFKEEDINEAKKEDEKDYRKENKKDDKKEKLIYELEMGRINRSYSFHDYRAKTSKINPYNNIFK